MQFKLEVGSYVIQVVPSIKSEDLETASDIPLFIGQMEKHEIVLQFLSYSEQLVKNFEESLPNLENPGPADKFSVEHMFSDMALKNKKVVKGFWSPENNFGTIRAKADCY